MAIGRHRPPANVTDAGLAGIAELTKLKKRLCLSGMKITDDGLVDLAQLDLGERSVSDAGLRHLAGLKELRTLAVYNTNVTSKGIDELARSLPRCYFITRPMTDPMRLKP